MPRRICIIFNPSAKGGKAVRFRRQMLEFESECAFKPTTQAGAGELLAAEAVREGFETIVAAGGDGTVNEVLNGIANEPEGFRRARLAVLPIGTVNVFAREMKVPLNLRRAWESIRAGDEQAIDLPWVDFRSGARRRCFAQLAGAGFDARAIELVRLDLKKRIGPLAYVVAGLKALRSKPCSLTVRCDGESLRGDFVIVGNGKLYGGPVPICPEANNTDGQLDICLFPRTTLAGIARHVAACLSPRLRNWSPAVMRQASALEIEGEEGVPLELDGDLAGRIPARCSIEPRGLRVVVPAA